MLWRSSFIVEPRYNKPHYNEVLGITNDWIFFAKAIVKYVENNLDITKPRYKEQISLSVSWPFVVSRYCSIDRLKPLSIHRQRKITSSLYSHCLKGRKKCTRQFRKVLWVILSSLFSKEIWKNGTRGHGRVFASTKGKQQRQCQEQCIHHIPYCLSGIVACTFFPNNLSRNSCISPNSNSLQFRKCLVYKVKNSIKAQEMCKLSN